MATAGKAVVRESGKRGVFAGGKGATFDAEGACPACCPCTPFVLASAIVNGTDPSGDAARWDLTPYQGPDMAPPGAFWRLIEVGTCYPGAYPWYGAGCVDAEGRLVGLPDEFWSMWAYDGYMELQIGCVDPTDDTQIVWPGTCQLVSGRFEC